LLAAYRFAGDVTLLGEWLDAQVLARPGSDHRLLLVDLAFYTPPLTDASPLGR